jgi:hypothetical protein
MLGYLGLGKVKIRAMLGYVGLARRYVWAS